MRMGMSVFAAGVVLAAAATCGADRGKASDAKAVDTAKWIKDGFVALFNGKDLTGWKVPAGDNGHWKVVDGVIDYDAASEAAGDKNLWTAEPYEDFTLHVQWRFKKTSGLYNMPIILPDGSYKTDARGKKVATPTPNADSGIFVRGTGSGQINIWCWPCGSGELWSVRNNKALPKEVRAGGVPKVKGDKPVGQWNTFVITMRRDRITVVLNGKTVIDDARMPGIPAAGPIALQHHGGLNKKTGKYNGASSLIQFRNIYIKRLKRTEPYTSAKTDQPPKRKPARKKAK